MVLVKPGARVPVDGVVVAGNSFVDQAPITGESLPVEKLPGSSVYAGTINQSGVIEVRTEGIGRDTAFGKIIEAVERAEQSRAPIQKTADRLAGYLVYFALGCAVLTFLVTQDVRSTISVVIVAGACGIAAGTPLAVLGAIGRAARQGAIIKGGLYLEALGHGGHHRAGQDRHADPGQPRSHRRASLSRRDPGERRASRRHCRASLRASPGQSHLAEGGGNVPSRHRAGAVRVRPGKGIACSLDGEQIVVGSRAFLEEQRYRPCHVRFCRRPLRPKCWWAATDACWGRSTSRTPCDRRRCRRSPPCGRWGCGRCCSPATPQAIAQAVGKRLGVDEVHAELLPDEKVAKIKALLAAGKQVAMVGDGINDAPALTASECRRGDGFGNGRGP